jgi:DNA-binding XRE family transcriptional regulator
MSAHTNIQIIKQNGHPAFVVIPYNEYIKVFTDTVWVPEGGLLPHKVVGLTIKKGYTLVRAWREYLGLTQKEVAEKMGITQAALSQMESSKKKLRKATLEKLASALGIAFEQIGGKSSVAP